MQVERDHKTHSQHKDFATNLKESSENFNLQNVEDLLKQLAKTIKI